MRPRGDTLSSRLGAEPVLCGRRECPQQEPATIGLFHSGLTRDLP